MPDVLAAMCIELTDVSHVRAVKNSPITCGGGFDFFDSVIAVGELGLYLAHDVIKKRFNTGGHVWLLSSLCRTCVALCRKETRRVLLTSPLVRVQAKLVLQCCYVICRLFYTNIIKVFLY